MATADRILSNFTPLEVADSLGNLSLDSQAKTSKVPEPLNKDVYGDNGSYMYQQTYGYMPYGAAYSVPSSPVPSMGHYGLHAIQEYHYPSPYYQPLLQTSQANASLVEFSNLGAADQALLSVETNKGNSTTIASAGGLSGNNGSGSLKSTFKGSSLNPNASYKRGGLPTGNLSQGYQDPRFSYDGVQSPIPWLDMPMYSNGQSEHATNNGSLHIRTIFHLAGITTFVPTLMSWGRGYGKENMDVLSELNKGPRVKGYKKQDGFAPSTLAVTDQNLPLTETNKENKVSLVPDMEHEDDVHKSIKYGVWASTSTGNKKLDAAFQEAKEKADGCPVFLLFSVNTSGQFVGLAEMVGPVDFNKTLEYWQQDKWTGCFPVKWHIVKDVPNSSLRHITLENNENKPVTNSRDTQEVNLDQGIQILKIFKEHSNKRSILDDFEFYEARQQIIEEKKAKHQLLQKPALNGTPNDVVATDNKQNALDTSEKSVESALTEEQKSNGDVKPVEENGSVAATEDGPKKSV
ncbi:hypothetical protein CCACVL1_22891 [Corchorus capsularis]|uniref:YTH domain-containing family protein n=1 Tax=Corchorus capsularis TaxID=210143 RepID=A0A1R3GW56_COCAP|nr:hypothetical protein CCACVL1_22891 [Corchorus capsularis]